MKTKTFFKWLCCSAILLIASVQPAWTNGVKGAWDGWTEHPLSNNSVSFNITTTGTFEFGYQEGDSYLRNSGTMTRSNCSGWHFEKGSGNCKLEVDKVGFYTFTFGDWEEYSKDNWGRTLSVTYPDGGFYDLYVECEVNGKSSSWQKSDGDKNFGDVTSFIIKRAYIKLWDNFGQNNTAWSKGGALGYKYNGGSSNYVNTGTGNDNAHWKGYDSSHPNNYEFFNKTAASNDLVRLVNDGSSTKKNSGNYTIEVWGKVNSTTNGWGDAYLKNGDNNFKWTFTILPPAVSSFAVSATSMTYGGDGSQANPYLVQCGSTLTLSASGSKEHEDANSSLEVKFGGNSYSATTTHNITVNSTTKKSIEVKGKYRNSTASLDGEESTKTIYYQAVYTGLTAVASPAAAVSNNPTISPTYTSSSVNVGAGTANTGYQFKNWSSDNGSFGSATTASTTFSPTANSAVATANYQIEVTFDKKGHGESTPTAQWIDYNGKVTNPGDLSEAGWEFGGWYKENTCTNQWNFSSDVVTSPITLYAKWTQSSVYYTITKGVNDDAMGSITSNAEDESQVLSGSTITFTATPNSGYEVVAWYTDAECSQGEHDAGKTTYSQVINSDATVYVKFKETKYAVTINKGTGISSVTPSGERQVGNVNPVGISAEVATGYTWNEWTKIGDVTITDASSSSTSIKATGTGTVTATATEILLPLTTSVNESYMGSVEETASSIGVATTSTLTASSANRNYKFKQWHLTNCTITSGTVNDATITIKGDGVNNPSAEAEFEVAWLISGNQDISTGWGASGTKMTVVSDGVFKFEFNATKVASNDGDYNFKVYNTTRTAYYANKKGDSGWWFTRGANSTTLAEGAQLSTNMSLRSDMVGNYIFTLDCSTSRENPTLTITFPTSTTYNVDIYYDGVTKTTVEGGEFAKQITAQVPESMTFDHWEVEGETTHVNITDVNSQTTTFTASGEGAVIRAKFNTNKRIYLKGGSNFANAYLNFYKEAYWNSDFGSGNTGSQCVQKDQQMNKISNTDIFWYDLNYASIEWKNFFTFVNKSGDFNNFHMCNVVYRDDMKDALPFYVPRNGYASEHHNSSQYFNEGIWMKYNSTESGYDLRGNWNWEDKTHRFVAATPGGYEFKTTITLAAGVTYEFKIYNDNGTNYGATNQTMTATSCTNWKMHLNNGNCKITASDEGDYTFTLNLGSGEVIVSVEYPLSANDYHVVAKQGGIVKWEGDLIKHSNEAKKDTTSFFNNNYTFQLQQYNGTSWSDIAGQTVTPAAEGSQGVIDLIVTQDGTGQATLAYEGIYTGNYYIRTDGVDGGWGDYKNNSDNKMENYGSSIDADPDYQYDVYKAKWVPSGKNVKFRIANDYSKAISDEFTTDDIIDNKETLPNEGANVRFMWNSTTNELKRAYLSGSTDDEKRYLMLINTNSKMYDKTGEAQIAELKFADNNNWVYQADIQAQPGCEVKLTAQYNSKVQYFIGSETTTRKIIDGSGDTKYTLRAVYDFKTNRLVAGWIPSGTIEDNIVLGSDMLIERIEQGDASQIVFGGAKPSSLSISEIQHIYGVLKLRKATMVGATETDYDKCIYWISFPFDVKVSEIFGVEKYGEVWAISNYRGDLRAQKGWFKQDTQTFWEFLKPSDIMKANVGYTLNLDPDYFNKDSSEPWKNSATEVAWYFPSIEENIGVVSLAQKDTVLPAQHCTIDREFNAGTEETPRIVNHKFTDSNWRVIGVPAFQNLQSPTFTPGPSEEGVFGLTGFYEWVPATNTYTARSASGYTFKATGAYMVQYEGKITWSDAAVITTNKAPWHAPEYTYADAKNYSITLEFGNDDYTDQTFVTLTEKASTDFVLNEDMMKIDNAGFPNIYSFAGAYDVAYNETTFDNQTVMLGVSAPKNGSYTFAMPKDFSGKAVLVDLESGEATDLNLSDYTVELNKGTYNNRFQLLLEVEAKAPTAIDNAKGEWSVDGKTKKLFINDNIYLINGGRIYNVLGVGE